jgi:hypothetical protein
MERVKIQKGKVLSFGEDLGEAFIYICPMTKEQVQDLRDRTASLRRHL